MALNSRIQHGRSTTCFLMGSPLDQMMTSERACSLGDVDAWMKANANRNGRNACTIQRIDDSHVRYSYFRREKGFLYNSYSLTNVIERIAQ